MRTVRQCGGGEAPRAAGVGRRGAEQRGAVIDIDRAASLSRAGQGLDIGGRDAVANDAGVVRERSDGRRIRRNRVDLETQRGGSSADIASGIDGLGRERMRAIGQGRRGEAPGAAAVGGGGTEQRGAVIDIDRLPASAVPVRVRTLADVMPSPTTPVSFENEATVGALGAAVSTLSLSAVEAALTLPAASTALAVKACAPSDSVAVVKLHAPPTLAVAVPSSVAPS